MNSWRPVFVFPKTKGYLVVFCALVLVTVCAMVVSTPQMYGGARSPLSPHSPHSPCSPHHQRFESYRLSPPHKKLQLLLVTQGRSGSSFTSDIIASSPDVFFTFEPLQVMNSQIWSSHVPMGKVYRILQSYLTCDFTKVSGSDLKLDFVKRTAVGRKFFNCENKTGLGFKHIQCLLNYINTCKAKDVSLVKVIRVPMSWVEPLLKDMPLLQILYLIRDPRAALRSQSHAFNDNGFDKPMGIQTGVAKHYCGKLLEDTTAFSNLAMRYPGRLRIARYEDGALNPAAYAKELFSTFGLNFTKSTSDRISFLGSVGKNESRSQFSLRRNSPEENISKWRTSPGGFKSAKIIDEICGELYSKFGYIPVTSEKELKGKKRPLFVDSDTFRRLRKKLEFTG